MKVLSRRRKLSELNREQLQGAITYFENQMPRIATEYKGSTIPTRDLHPISSMFMLGVRKALKEQMNLSLAFNITPTTY